MREIKQSTTANVMVFMADSTDHVTGKTGLTLTITASKNGAAFGSITPDVTARGNGWYNLAITAAHSNTLGDLCLHITGAGADPSDLKIIVVEYMLDAAVSSRATPADIAAELTPGVIQNKITITDGTAQTVVRGDAKKLTLNAGAEWDMTGKKVYFIAKADRTADNSTAIVDRECTVTDAANGIAEITLTTSETASVGFYHAEFEMRDDDGVSNPQTIMQLELRIIQDVRQ